LDECTLAIPSGEVFGLLGPNGAGKTTLLRLLLGYLRPTSGTARIEGLDPAVDVVAVHERVSYLPGDVRLYRSMRPLEFLSLIGGLRRDDSLIKRALHICERFELDVSRRISQMSTGMRQKLALAATLAAETPLLILDEPTTSLDPTMRQTVGELVREAHRIGRTVIFSSHVLSEVEDVCHRVAIMRQGRLARIQAISELRRQHRIEGHLPQDSANLPPELSQVATSISENAGHIVIHTSADLPTILRCIADLPWRDLRIEPVGLRAAFDEVHHGMNREPDPPT
ncbi:MAG TPA: ABC transporter ATP-binding protein, partial [Pirellulaceae bacterium]